MGDLLSCVLTLLRRNDSVTQNELYRPRCTVRALCELHLQRLYLKQILSDRIADCDNVLQIPGEAYAGWRLHKLSDMLGAIFRLGFCVVWVNN